MTHLRLAVVGLGRIGRVHLEHIAASADCVLCAVADPGPANAPDGVPRYGDVESLLAAQRPDGVILATPNALHVSGALACLAAGVPCLVEKPVSADLGDARRLAEAVTASGVPVLVGHHRRHSAVIQAAAQVVRSGALGRLVAISGSATYVKPDRYFTEGPWRGQPGGGPILINLIHEIDNLRTLAGEVVQVQAMASNATRSLPVEDTVAIGLRFASGALGTFLLSDTATGPRSWEQTTGENPDYDHHADEDCYNLAGTRGSLAVPTLRLRQYEAEASWFEPLVRVPVPVQPDDPLARQLAHFCAVIRGEVQPLVTVADATRTLAVTLAVARAAAQSSMVSCEAAS